MCVRVAAYIIIYCMLINSLHKIKIIQAEGNVDIDGKSPSIWDTFTTNHPGFTFLTCLTHFLFI